MKSEPAHLSGTGAHLRYRRKLQIGHLMVLLLIILVCVFPFYWMVATSLKNQQDILSPVPKFLFTPTLENYERALTKQCPPKGD